MLHVGNSKEKSVEKYYIKYATYHRWILKFNCRWKEQERQRKYVIRTYSIYDDTSSLRYSVEETTQGLALVLI